MGRLHLCHDRCSYIVQLLDPPSHPQIKKKEIKPTFFFFLGEREGLAARLRCSKLLAGVCSMTDVVLYL